VEGWNTELKDYMKKRQIFLGDRAGGEINVISRFHWMKQNLLKNRVGGEINAINR